jgi:hypothetical protein
MPRKSKKVIGYKGFNKGLTCRGFGYQVGKSYKHNGEIELCQRGFHFCENPLDILNYYDLVDSDGMLTEFARVEATGKVKSRDDKSVTDKLTIKARITIPTFVKASFDFMWAKNNENMDGLITDEGHYSRLATSGDYSQLATSGHYSRLATSGDYSQLATSGHSSRLATSGHSSRLATSGDYSQLATSGHSSRLATSGDYSRLATSGHYSRLATSGDYSRLATSGDYSRLATSGHSSRLATSGHYSQLATSGDYSRLATSGDYSRLAIKGKHSAGAALGRYSTIQGVKGTWITLAEYDSDRQVVCVKSAQIDGKVLKANTPYSLVDGEFEAQV